ncbi:matrix metalloproteinase-24-like [Watersipora subatra]|uniref:matrix metalloproteinase-24-like n=1 Tax=Watersipora subatra TaxID=2589382 RepID=UPI00355C515C
MAPLFKESLLLNTYKLVVFLLTSACIDSASILTSQVDTVSTSVKSTKVPSCREDEFTRKLREKRFSRIGDKVWVSMPVSINFHQYHSEFSREDQEEVLQYCTTLYSLPGRLWFVILKPSVTADISIHFKHFDGNKYKGDFGYAFAPQPGGTSYIQLEDKENWKLTKRSRPLLKQGQPISFQFAVCHELGHALGLGHIDDRKAIMNAKYYGQQESHLSDEELNSLNTLYQPALPENFKQIAEDFMLKPLAEQQQPSQETTKKPRRSRRKCRRRRFCKV